MRYLIALALVLMSAPVLADCDMELTTNVQYQGSEKEATNVRSYFGLSDSAAREMQRKIDKAYRQAQTVAKNKNNLGGKYSMTLLQTGSCPVTQQKPESWDGLSTKGVTQVWRILNKHDTDLATAIDPTTPSHDKQLSTKTRAFGKTN